jgi:hypothetical protein
MKINESKKKLADTGYKLGIIVFSLLVASYAWFTTGTDVDVSQLSIATDAYTDIELSLDGSSWSHQLNLQLGDNYSFSSDVTGNGINLYKASEKDSTGAPILFENAISNVDYLEFDLYIRSKTSSGIFLENNSSILPLAGTNSEDLLGTDVDRKSSFGNYSRDLIASAVRVSFVEHDYISENFVIKDTPNLVWAPNKNYEMVYNNGIYTALIDSTNSQNYNYIDVVGGVSNGELRHVNLKDVISADYDTKRAYGDPILTRLPNVIDDYNVAKMTIKVWLEGNDRDAVVALKGGIFTMALKVVGLPKSFDDVNPIVTANTELMTINNYDSTMEYSLDYGTNWTKYQDDNNPIFEVGDVVYVRKQETTTHFASTYEELSF